MILPNNKALSEQTVSRTCRKQTGVELTASTLECLQFHSPSECFNFGLAVSILGPLYTRAEMSFIPAWILSRDEIFFILHEPVHPGMPGRKSSRPSWIHLARAYITLYFIPERLFTLRFSSRSIPGWHFIPVLRTGMKSSRDEFIPGRNHVSPCRQQQENDQTPRWKSSRDENSHVKRPLVTTHLYNHSIRYVEGEHLDRCAPETVASGLEKLPLTYGYNKDGSANTSIEATKELPTGEKLVGTNTYKSLMRFYTTFDITPEQLREKSEQRLENLLEQVINN